MNGSEPVLVHNLKVGGEPCVDVGEPLDQQREVAVDITEVWLGAGHVLGEPLTVLERHESVLSPVPDLDGHADRLEPEPPRVHVCYSVVPPALLARSQAISDASDHVPGELARDDGGVDVRQQCLPRLP